jgi:hypothetical protein
MKERAHILGGPESCWCNPRTFIVCPACGEHKNIDPGCWQCGGQGVIDAPSMTDLPTIEQHNGVSSVTFIRKEPK